MTSPRARLHVLAVAALALAACGTRGGPPAGAKRMSRPAPVYVAADDGEPWLRLDIDTDLAVRYRDAVVYDPATDHPIVLERALQSLREAAVTAGDATMWPVEVEGTMCSAVRDPVRLEVHRYALWSAVQEFLHVAASPGVSFWGLQLALYQEQ